MKERNVLYLSLVDVIECGSIDVVRDAETIILKNRILDFRQAFEESTGSIICSSPACSANAPSRIRRDHRP